MDVTQSKELLVFLARLASGIKGALEDGQIGFSDLDELFAPIMASKAAFEGIDVVPKELADLNDEEAAELVSVIQTELDLGGIKAEEITEEGLALAIKLVAFVNKVRA